MKQQETPRYHTRNRPETNNDHYLLNCYVCGQPVHIIYEIEQPHRCRIDLDAQRNTTASPYYCGWCSANKSTGTHDPRCPVPLDPSLTMWLVPNRA